MDFAQGLLLCEICRAEVIDNEDAESVQGSKDRMQRFNNQMRFHPRGAAEKRGHDPAGLRCRRVDQEQPVGIG